GLVAQAVEHALVAGELRLGLGEERDARGRRARDVAVERRKLADERAHEGGLPRSVRADDGDAGAALDAQGRGPDDDAVAVTDGERRRLQDGRTREMRRLEAPAMRRRRPRRVDPLETGELLRAAA